MIDQRSGAIVPISSRGALFGGVTACATAKAAIIGMTASLSTELRPHGVTINCILPSAEAQLFPNTGVRLPGSMPPSLSMDIEDVAPVVVYLASERAKGVTGRFIYISGGDICLYPHPFQVSGATFLRKMGRWTLAELDELLPPLLGTPGS
jgi:3-oxoacyl-[acyl-carrier protein] reductase